MNRLANFIPPLSARIPKPSGLASNLHNFSRMCQPTDQNVTSERRIQGPRLSAPPKGSHLDLMAKELTMKYSYLTLKGNGNHPEYSSRIVPQIPEKNPRTGPNCKPKYENPLRGQKATVVSEEACRDTYSQLHFPRRPCCDLVSWIYIEVFKCCYLRKMEGTR